MNANPCRALIVTGGSGYLGDALIAAALAEERKVSLLSRVATRSRPDLRRISWRLGAPLPQEALHSDIAPAEQALIHFAHDWCDRDAEGGSNLVGARILRDSARALGIGRIVFVSSQSARPDALNAYGRMKWHIEQLFDAPNEISMRVGLVYGGPQKAQYGLLCKLAMMTSLMPMVRPRQQVQPIHRREVARGILLAADSSFAGPLGLAGPGPISFAQFLDRLAWRLRGGRMRLVPVPLAAVLLLCAVIDRLPFLPSIDRERILGLAGTRVIETRADLDRLGLTVRSFEDGMVDEPGSRRAVLREGRTLLRFILGRPPGGALLGLYGRAVAATGPGGAMRLPRLVHAAPWLLCCLEPVNGRGSLAHRLKLATALAAASPETAQALARGGRTARLVRLGGAVLRDAAVMPLRLVATAWQR